MEKQLRHLFEKCRKAYNLGKDDFFPLKSNV
jgi:hypothetical protein